MDLSDDVAQEVLDAGIQQGKQIYGYKGGKPYVFQPDGAGGYHGYQVTGKTRVPASILREWRDQGVISPAEYKNLLKGGGKR
jgi:hypothetical protein